MQQRRLRPGDILDDYCPRERRVTTHAIVAMVEDDIKQTRCTTCDAEHEFKHGKVPTLRRRKDAVSAAYKEVLASVTSDPLLAPHVVAPPRTEAPAADAGPAAPADTPGRAVGEPPAEAAAMAADEAAGPAAPEAGESAGADAGRVHRRLIRATLPRLENQPVVRPIPEFTMHQPAGRGGKFRGGMARGAASRPGSGGRGGHGGNARGQAFGRPGSSQGGRPSGRNDMPRHGRGHQPARHGKKHSK